MFDAASAVQSNISVSLCEAVSLKLEGSSNDLLIQNRSDAADAVAVVAAARCKHGSVQR